MLWQRRLRCRSLICFAAFWALQHLDQTKIIFMCDAKRCDGSIQIPAMHARRLECFISNAFLVSPNVRNEQMAAGCGMREGGQRRWRAFKNINSPSLKILIVWIRENRFRHFLKRKMQFSFLFLFHFVRPLFANAIQFLFTLSNISFFFCLRAHSHTQLTTHARLPS